MTGAEIDGRTTAHDLHLDWMLSKKKPFIGKAMMNRPGLTDEKRLTLVGILSANGKPIPGGSHIVDDDELTEPARSLGHVTATCYSLLWKDTSRWRWLPMARAGSAPGPLPRPR